MIRLLMALQALCTLWMVSRLPASFGEEPFLVWLFCASASLRLPRQPSRLLRRSSLLFLFSGPLAAAGTLALEGPERATVSLCGLLVFLTGWLFYWLCCEAEPHLSWSQSQPPLLPSS